MTAKSLEEKPARQARASTANTIKLLAPLRNKQVSMNDCISRSTGLNLGLRRAADLVRSCAAGAPFEGPAVDMAPLFHFSEMKIGKMKEFKLQTLLLWRST